MGSTVINVKKCGKYYAGSPGMAKMTEDGLSDGQALLPPRAMEQ
jgi:hypothetical protein